MSSATSFPVPVPTKAYTAVEKSCTIQPHCDIGAFLNHIKIQPFEKITVNLKPGDYHWEENVALPERS